MLALHLHATDGLPFGVPVSILKRVEPAPGGGAVLIMADGERLVVTERPEEVEAQAGWRAPEPPTPELAPVEGVAFGSHDGLSITLKINGRGFVFEDRRALLALATQLIAAAYYPGELLGAEIGMAGRIEDAVPAPSSKEARS